MKKEVFAGALLAALLALSILNTRAIARMCDEMSGFVAEAGVLASAGDMEGADAALSKAMALWEEKKTYTQIVLRHTDIGTMSDDFCELREHILAGEPGAVAGSVELVQEHLTGIKEMESFRLGSIF